MKAGIKNRWLGFLLILLGIACQTKMDRDFFKEVTNKKITLGDSIVPFMKDFQLSDKDTTILGKKYWKITSDIDQVFHINGYLRKEHNKLILLPFPDQVKGKNNEFVWLDFAASVNQS